MNDYIEENKRSLFILAGALFVLVGVLFFVLVYPMMTDLKRNQTNIESKKTDIELLEAELANIGTEEIEFDEETLANMKKIPRERKLDEYILALQALELTNNSKIESVAFAYDSSMDLEETEEGAETPEEYIDEEESDTNEESDETEEESDEEETETDEDDTPTIDPVILQEKPEQLQVMTVSMTAQSPSYKDFLALIETIEDMERISIVTNLHFSQPSEEDEFIEDPMNTVPFEAEITTFYYVD
ncbi:MAG TPA: hypothetical protein VK067_03645 [Pseudogracilibacillus sp.]|nr:hypothetical protein [Pseudogracilibacillus sp.]